jgi:hypothetical protein
MNIEVKNEAERVAADDRESFRHGICRLARETMAAKQCLRLPTTAAVWGLLYRQAAVPR